ncbi:MAG: CCA tRNA nucleotidyltransferase [Candidatus Thermoplasmatota archaeon]|nr:CCA tRNA nucleotidyltransferase [Candidatus Thermoplasmatota archaeon]
MSAKLKQIEEKVLDQVKPNAEKREEIERVSEELLEAIEEHLEPSEKPRLVGSVSKGTFLNDPDIDIFVKFPISTAKDEMEKKILDLGEEILEETEERYAEHPYIHGTFQGFKADIVPCYDIEEISQMKSAVDRTPFHTDYVGENLSSEQRDEAILLKAYLKGIDAYGAEAKVWGFSGYLCELLILHYGSFENVLKNAKDWRPKKILEMVEGERSFEDPLVVIDPVDPERNVASPVSLEKFALFVLSSKMFLKEPKLRFFFPNGLEEKSAETLSEILEERSTDLVGWRFPKPDIVQDNLYPQVQRCIKKFKQHLIRKDFEILHSDYFVKDEVVLLIFEVEYAELSKIKKHRGPPVWIDNTEEFIAKYGEDAYLEGERSWVDRERKNSSVKDAMRQIMKEVDLGSAINPMLEEKGEFLADEQWIEEEKRALNKFLDKKFPWEH